MAFELRPYQKECIDIIDNKPDGKYLIVMATGLGKTATFTHFKRNGRTLILSHRDELVRQPQKFYDCSFGVEKADEKATDEEIVSASIQSISKDNRLHRYAPDAFDLIIVDEAHHCAASSYRKVLDYFTGAKKIVGVTATPSRNDKVGLDKIFNEIAFSKDLRWGIQNGYLCRLRAARVSAHYSLKNVKKIAGDFSQADLDSVMDEGVFATAAKTYATSCYPEGKHVLVYCTTKAKVKMAVDLFRAMIPKEEADTIQMILGDTPQCERDTILENFRAGSVKVIVNCMVLTEGTDLPICDAIINLRPTANQSLYQQMIGRGTRLYDGKEYATVYDIIPDDQENRKNICTAPTLFGLDPELLDKKLQKKINKDTDLMDLCDELTGICMDIVKVIQVQVEMTEAFIDSAEELQNSSKSLKDLANKVDHMEKDSIPDDIDFGNLRVIVQPYESSRYLILPTYGSSITLSEPNILGETTIRIALEKEYFEKFFVNSGLEYMPEMQATMKFGEAIKLTKALCAAAPGYFRPSWDATAREDYRSRGLTQKQQYRVSSNYARSLNDVGRSTLTMYDAATLIDFHSKVDNAKKMVEKYTIRPKQRKTTKDRIAESYREEFCHENTTILNKKQIQMLLNVAEIGHEMEESCSPGVDVSKIDWSNANRFQTLIDAKFLHKGKTNEKQSSYANALVEQLKIKKIYMDKKINFANEESYITSTFIDMMVGVKKRNLDPSVEALVINTDSVKALANNALKCANMRKVVQGHVTCSVIRK